MRTVLALSAFTLLGALALLAGAAPAGCDGATTGVGGDPCTQATFRCATPACADSPSTPGCDDVAPALGRCPVGRPRCVDPVTSPGYCEPGAHRCGTLWDPPRAGCDYSGACSMAEAARCFNLDGASLICHAGQRCITIACDDGGAPADLPTDGATRD